jgi:hypothetical protein
MAETQEKKTVFVCSKLAGDQAYTLYFKDKTGGKQIPRVNRVINIKGGAGVINKQLQTPYGVVTPITEDQLDALRKGCPSFNRHVKRGFLKVLETDPSQKEIKKIADDMDRDKSSQKTPDDLIKDVEKKPGDIGYSSEG